VREGRTKSGVTCKMAFSPSDSCGTPDRIDNRHPPH
jgi:hypothetical protein